MIPEWFKIAFDGIGTVIIMFLFFLIFSLGKIFFEWLKNKKQSQFDFIKYIDGEYDDKFESINKNKKGQININNDIINIPSGNGTIHYCSGKSNVTITKTNGILRIIGNQGKGKK